VAARSEALVCGRMLAGIVGSNLPGEQGYLSVVNVVRCQVEISASGGSLVQISPTYCVASLCGSINLMSEEVIARFEQQRKKKVDHGWWHIIHNSHLSTRRLNKCTLFAVTTLFQCQVIWCIISRLEMGYSQLSNLAWEKSGTPVWVVVKRFSKIRLSFLMNLAFFPHVSISRLSGALYYEHYKHFETHVNSYRKSDKNTGRVLRFPAVIPTATCIWLRRVWIKTKEKFSLLQVRLGPGWLSG
jgi:hypothetical protein